MIQRVYIDTSVIGGCIDNEFKEWSVKLFNEFRNGRKIAVISDITLDELELAPDKIRKYNSINLEQGYNILEIRSPRDIVKCEVNETG